MRAAVLASSVLSYATVGLNSRRTLPIVTREIIYVVRRAVVHIGVYIAEKIVNFVRSTVGPILVVCRTLRTNGNGRNVVRFSRTVFSVEVCIRSVSAVLEEYAIDRFMTVSRRGKQIFTCAENVSALVVVYSAVVCGEPFVSVYFDFDDFRSTGRKNLRFAVAYELYGRFLYSVRLVVRR